jgi:PTS system nitrogen regulatory IIA component
LVKSGTIKERDSGKLVQILNERESLGSTGIGQGVAIPHGKANVVDGLIAAFGISKQGIEFDALDGEPVYIFFLLIAPEDSAGPHLKALARISRLLKDKHFRDMLRSAESTEKLLQSIKNEDERRQ